MQNKERLDILLSDLSGYSREFSKELIKSGNVFVDNVKVTKPGIKLDCNKLITYDNTKKLFVSRGGYKLKKALEYFNLDVTDKTCIDVGSSTGGFTDCLIYNNAYHIYAIDSGTDQLHSSLRLNKKITLLENTNIKNVTPDLLGTLCDFAAIDVSFISLTKVLKPLKRLLTANADIAALIKPQFELEKKLKLNKGIVKDKKKHVEILKKIYIYCIYCGLTPVNITFSPIKGYSGNIEYLIHIKNKTFENTQHLLDDTIIKKITDDAFINL